MLQRESKKTMPTINCSQRLKEQGNRIMDIYKNLKYNKYTVWR